MSPALREIGASDPFDPQIPPQSGKPWLSDDEEELLALQLNELISEDDANKALEQFQSELAPHIKLPSLEADT